MPNVLNVFFFCTTRIIMNLINQIICIKQILSARQKVRAQ